MVIKKHLLLPITPSTINGATTLPCPSDKRRITNHDTTTQVRLRFLSHKKNEKQYDQTRTVPWKIPTKEHGNQSDDDDGEDQPKSYPVVMVQKNYSKRSPHRLCTVQIK